MAQETAAHRREEGGDRFWTQEQVLLGERCRATDRKVKAMLQRVIMALRRMAARHRWEQTAAKATAAGRNLGKQAKSPRIGLRGAASMEATAEALRTHWQSICRPGLPAASKARPEAAPGHLKQQDAAPRPRSPEPRAPAAPPPPQSAVPEAATTEPRR